MEPIIIPKQYNEKKRLLIEFRRYITWTGTGKSIQPYLGADVGFIREWIENMFSEKMNWDNYGEVWVIDHIVPLRMFDTFNSDDLRICWNYRNLMPLLKEDNLKKEGNAFFALELLHSRKDKDFFYSSLFERIKPEVEWMLKYIDNYDSKHFK